MVEDTAQKNELVRKRERAQPVQLYGRYFAGVASYSYDREDPD
jgi:hypothetical protein